MQEDEESAVVDADLTARAVHAGQKLLVTQRDDYVNGNRAEPSLDLPMPLSGVAGEAPIA